MFLLHNELKSDKIFLLTHKGGFAVGYKKWKVAQIDKTLALELARECDIDPLTALLLTARGMTDPAEIEEFLADEVELPDPFSLIDMDKAVDRIQSAIESAEKIVVYGDYDADGITATALLYNCLLDMGADVVYRLPTRDEGYGLNEEVIAQLKEQGVTLIVTVDNGITAIDEISFASEQGLDVVVTDHHLPTDVLPDAVAVVDPHREDCPSEYKSYAGVGVAFLLAAALSGYDWDTLLYQYGDLVCIGTIADVMPLTADNRTLVRCGLNCINSHPRAGVLALCKAANYEGKQLEAVNVAFILAPRINAAGRVEDPELALRLLLCESEQEAESIAQQLSDCNAQRKQLENEILAEIRQQIEKDSSVLHQPVLVFKGEGWHGGVLGIVAARMCEAYSKPAVVFSLDEEKAVGSCRSFQNISLHDLLSAVADDTVKFGGHETAAGVTVSREHLTVFEENLQKAAKEKYPLMPFGEQIIDCKLNPQSLSVDTVYAHLQLAPFGTGNPAPLYGLFGMQIVQKNAVGASGQHTKLLLERNGTRVPAVWFGASPDDLGYDAGDLVDVAVALDVSTYGGKESLSIVVRDCKPSSVDFDEFLTDYRRYENYLCGNALNIEVPTRDEFAVVYRKLALTKVMSIPDDMLQVRFKMPYLKVKIILQAMNELGLAVVVHDGKYNRITICKTENKVDLFSAECLQKLKAQVE